MARFIGTDAYDTFYGTDESDLFAGRGGDDNLFGGGGDDRIYGGDYWDQLYGESGNDLLNGGNGSDTLSGGDGNDVMYGAAGNDDIYTNSNGIGLGPGLSESNAAYGGAGDDNIEGAGYDLLYGQTGNDALIGSAFRSFLYGGRGGDFLAINTGEARGGRGDDSIITGIYATNDGSGALIFTGTGHDVVYDYFRADGVASTATVGDFSANDRLEFRVQDAAGNDIYDAFGNPMFLDASVKSFLDTNDDGVLSDADGGDPNLPGWDVVLLKDGLAISIGEDTLILAHLSAYDFTV